MYIICFLLSGDNAARDLGSSRGMSSFPKASAEICRDRPGRSAVEVRAGVVLGVFGGCKGEAFFKQRASQVHDLGWFGQTNRFVLVFFIYEMAS